MKANGHIQYRLDYSRRRTLSIIVSPEKGVVVKAPFHTSVRTVEKFVNAKSEWIARSLKKFDSMVRIDKQEGYSDGDSFLLFGKHHKLLIRNGDKISVGPIENDNILLTVRNESNPLLIKSLLESWLKYVAGNELKAIFREVLVKYKNYGFSPTGFVVRRMKTRWGTCSSKGKIALSSDLIRLDKIYGEYVIVHELCHLRHHNHGAGFYSLLSELYPEWKIVREGLKRYIR
jgi:predicted metal-dependent hydrolase